MTNHRFASFRFDAARLELRNASGPVPLRPKTAALLRVLLNRQGEVVAKKDIVQAVWHTAHVQDQTLFQTMSELRRHLAPLDAIRTHPNIGYEWCVPVATDKPSRLSYAVAAGCLLAIAVGALPFLADHERTSTTPRASAALPPALLAFSAGMTRLQAGDRSHARKLFELALMENPRFDEARLMLAETLLGDGATDAARSQARTLVASPGVLDAYVQIAALDLMSRSDERLGNADAALRQAMSAVAEARTLGYVCAAADLEDRVEALLAALHREVAAGDHPATEPHPGVATLADRPDFCREIEESERGAALGPERRAPGAAIAQIACRREIGATRRV